MRALAALLLCVAGAAHAQDGLLTGTLRTVRDRGTLLMGVRDSAVPFSFANRGGQPVGFSVDLCLGVAADVAAALNMELLPADAPAWRTGLRAIEVVVAPDARIPGVVSGAIDIECGSTTANAERAKSVAFSPVFFLAGTKLMVAPGTPSAPADLAGRTVAVSAGTTNADVMRTLARRHGFTVAEAPDLPAAFAMLADGRAAAFASDDILLAGMLATAPGPARFQVAGDYLSYEPYALMFRRDDIPFATLVRDSFARMAREGTLRALYNRWFTARLPTGQTLGLPMSAHLGEMYRALGED